MTFRIPLRWLERLLTRLGVVAYFIFGEEREGATPGTYERPLEALRLTFGRESLLAFQRRAVIRAQQTGRYIAGEDA